MTIHQFHNPDAEITPELLRAQSFDADITMDEFREIAEVHDSMSANFRAGLMMLARSSDFLMETSKDDKSEAFDTWMKLIEYIKSSIEISKQEVELMEKAELRTMILLAKLAPEADLLSSDVVTQPDVREFPEPGE